MREYGIEFYGKILLYEDMVYGILAAIPSVIWYKVWVIPVGLLCAFFWALGGQFGHSKRFIGVPTTIVLPIMIMSHGFIHSVLLDLFSYIPMAIILSLGYGLPDPPDRPDPDEGSPLGRFWAKVFGFGKPYYNELEATICARGTIILGIWLCMIPFFFLS